MKNSVQKGGKLCSLLKTNPLAILHLFSVPCKEMLGNNAFFQKIQEHFINYVQFTPIQNSCLIRNHIEVIDDITKQWFLYYQPINNKLGNELHGTEQNIIDATKEFKSRNINVIADVVFSHLRHVYLYEENTDIGVKYIKGKSGTTLLLLMSKLVSDETIDIKTNKLTFFDLMYNIEKFYGKDLIKLDEYILDFNQKKYKEIINYFFNYPNILKNDNIKKINKENKEKGLEIEPIPLLPLRDDAQSLTRDEVRIIKADILKYIQNIKNIICDYLEIDISEFKFEYYDILAFPYPGRPYPVQYMWFMYMPKLNHYNKTVQIKTFEYLQKLADIGIVGLRFDFAMGLEPAILARYSQFFYNCVPHSEKSKVYIYAEIVNKADSIIYDMNEYLNDSNYKLDTGNKKLKITYTSYTTLYNTLSICIDKNYKALRGLSIDEEDVVVFSETHDTMWNKPLNDPRNIWYNSERSRNSTIIPFDYDTRSTISMNMLCYFLSRSCRIPLIYLNQINFDGIFDRESIAYRVYSANKPSTHLQSNVYKCLQFRNFLIQNEIGNENNEYENWENDAEYNSVYISTKYIGRNQAIATIFINFENNRTYIPYDNIYIEPYGVYIKFETAKDVYKKLGYKII